MDEKNQNLILKNISRLKNIKYIILSSHDKKVMKFCDKIIYFKN
jgi:ABC-type lipoprotein export system ATPase subunit